MLKTSDLSPIIYGTRDYFHVFIKSKYNIDTKITMLYNSLTLYCKYI